MHLKRIISFAFILTSIAISAQNEDQLEFRKISNRSTPHASYYRYNTFYKGAQLIDHQYLEVFHDGELIRTKKTWSARQLANLPKEINAPALLWMNGWHGVQLDTLIEGRTHICFIKDLNGNILETRDLTAHYSTDTVVNVRVFLPDPLTPNGLTYSTPYTDLNDQNAAILDSLTIVDTIGVFVDQDTVRLKNDFVELQDFDAPYTPVSTNPSAWINGRSDPEFEQVSALYHITRMNQYLGELGYPHFLSYAIHVDAQAMNGMDNSMFNYGYTPPRLYFGEGGVDDAEDADVVIHELGHALSHAAAPGSNSGQQRRTFDEALGDYFAERYGRLYGVNSNRVFDWDGNNEYWAGRSVSYDGIKSYPNLTFGNIYQHTDLMASAMLELSASFNDPSKGDLLVLEVMHALMPFEMLSSISEEFLVADSLLYGGQNAATIYSIFGGTRQLLNAQSITESASTSIVQLQWNTAYWQLMAKHDQYSVDFFDSSGRLLQKKEWDGTPLRLPKGATFVLVLKDGKRIFSSGLPQ